MNASLDDADMRSKDIKATQSFTISAPLDLTLAILVDGVDKTGETIMIPAGESVNVTARAGGLNEGDTVTFTTPVGSVDATAGADGNAESTVPLSGEGSVTVTATSGQYSTSVEITYVQR